MIEYKLTYYLWTGGKRTEIVLWKNELDTYRIKGSSVHEYIYLRAVKIGCMYDTGE